MEILIFGFARSGELLKLFNDGGGLVDTVHYDDRLPWPEEPDGDGATLQLSDPALDNALASSWFATLNNFGTPGMLNGIGTGIFDPENDLADLNINPNPSSSNVTLTIPGEVLIDANMIKLFNSLGEEIRSVNISGNSVQLERKNLAAGMYSVILYDNDANSIAKAKLIFID